MFKQDLKDLAFGLRRDIQVAHDPPGCSKYNPIEHRVFCHVTHRFKGVVLKSLDIAKRLISRATTSGGLRVIVETTSKLYAKGRKATHDFLK